MNTVVPAAAGRAGLKKALPLRPSQHVLLAQPLEYPPPSAPEQGGGDPEWPVKDSP